MIGLCLGVVWRRPSVEYVVDEEGEEEVDQSVHGEEDAAKVRTF
jgi:hypothetical protein